MNGDEERQAEVAEMPMTAQFRAVREDLSHVRALLHEAASGLLADTLAMRNAARQLNGQAAALSEEHTALVQQIAARIDACVMHLQFDDMVAQLLTHAEKRVDAIESLFLKTGVGADEAVAPDQVLCSPVACQTLCAGDVELF